MSLDSARPSRARALLGHRDLVLVLGAGLVSQTGDWVLATGIAFQVYVLAGSTLASAGVLLATQVPQVVVSSVAGVLVDRWDRRRVMIITNVIMAATLVPLVTVQDASRLWVVYVVVALSSCVAPFFTAAEATMVPALVGSELLVTANAANAQLRNVARLIGAALGGAFVAAGGLTWLAVADVVTFLLATGLVVLVRLRPVRGVVARSRLRQDWLEGVAVIRRNRALVVVVVFFALSGVGESIMGTLFAPFVHDVLGGTARTYGTVVAAQAVGGIVGGLVITASGHRLTARSLFGWGALVFGVLDLVLFLYPLVYPEVWPAVLVIALVGLPAAALVAGALTVFQLATTDDVRGRVFGAVTTVQNGAMLTSTLAVGAMAGRAGIVPVISVQGAVYVLCGVVVLVFLRPDRTVSRPAPSGAAAPRRGSG